MKVRNKAWGVQIEKKPNNSDWLPKLTWGIAILLLVIMVGMLMYRAKVVFSDTQTGQTSTQSNQGLLIPENSTSDASLPAFEVKLDPAIRREADAHTIIPNRPRSNTVEHIVVKGDSIFSIANKYKLKPETVLWANYEQLDDNPNMVSINQKLLIPPTDGVYYKWVSGDTLQVVADRYKVKPEDIISWPSNRLDLTNPVIEPGAYVMVPKGWRENRQWLVPTVWRANSGASRNLSGPGACELPEGGAFGTGAFIWPTATRLVSGNDYWSGHLGIDIGAADGAPLYAADSGMVVYSGSIGGGYGLMIMIDHGNGYHTLYAHLSSTVAKCGQSVSQGQVIGYTGSSGNSTGPHLHFEVRLNGGFVNPHYVLP